MSTQNTSTRWAVCAPRSESGTGTRGWENQSPGGSAPLDHIVVALAKNQKKLLIAPFNLTPDIAKEEKAGKYQSEDYTQEPGNSPRPADTNNTTTATVPATSKSPDGPDPSDNDSIEHAKDTADNLTTTVAPSPGRAQKFRTAAHIFNVNLQATKCTTCINCTWKQLIYHHDRKSIYTRMVA